MQVYIPMLKQRAIKEEGEAVEVVKVFADRSCIEGGVGAVAVLYREGIEKRLIRKHLGMESEHTVFEAEVVGLILAAKLVQAERGVSSAMLGADNQAALKAMRRTKGASGQHLVDCFHEQVDLAQWRHPGARIVLRWTPGHMGMV